MGAIHPGSGLQGSALSTQCSKTVIKQAAHHLLVIVTIYRHLQTMAVTKHSPQPHSRPSRCPSPPSQGATVCSQKTLGRT